MLNAHRTVLVVVDLQEKLLPPIPNRETLLRNARLLLRLARTLDIPILLTTQYSKGLGPVVPEIAADAPDALTLDKTAFGGFGDDAFRGAMETITRGQLLVCGVETHICVAQTVLGALERRFEVHVVSDAVGTRTAENHRIGLARMERAGAALSSAEMAAYELMERSDTPAFKAMLPHIKG